LIIGCAIPEDMFTVTFSRHVDCDSVELAG